MNPSPIGAPMVRTVSVGVDEHSFVSHGRTLAGTNATVVAGAMIREDDRRGAPVSFGLLIATGALATMIAARAEQDEEPLPVRATFDGVCWETVSAARPTRRCRALRLPARISAR